MNLHSLLVYKIHSIDPDWLRNVYYTEYGGRNWNKGYYVQSTATAVPCLEGEWVVVYYSKKRKEETEDGTCYSSDWHRYYLCQIDFSQKHDFKIIEEFEHMYDALQYLLNHQLVSVKKSDKRFKKQVPVIKANLVLDVLTPFENLPGAYGFYEMRDLFGQKATESEKAIRFVEENFKNYDTEAFESDIEYRNDYVYRVIRRMFPIEPFIDDMDTDKRLTIKEFLDKVRKYKENYIWNI